MKWKSFVFLIKISGSITLVLLLFIGFIHTKYLFLNDVSIQPVDPAICPDVGTLTPRHRPPVYLVSYAVAILSFLKINMR